MSNTQYAFLMRSRVPSRESLQVSIDALGFDLKLDPNFTPFTDSGFSPCVLNGTGDVGFEVFYQPAADIEGLDAIAGANDFCISMTWHSSMKDCASVMIVSCALAKDFGAVISYEGEAPEPVEVLIEQTRGIIKDAENERPSPTSHIHAREPSPKKPWWRIW